VSTAACNIKCGIHLLAWPRNIVTDALARDLDSSANEADDEEEEIERSKHSVLCNFEIDPRISTQHSPFESETGKAVQ